ncbi:MAG: LptA/OstA family protein [Pseudomonadota bacterium]
MPAGDRPEPSQTRARLERRTSRFGRYRVGALLLGATVLVAVNSVSANAQQLGAGFGGFAANRDAPIQIDANGLEVNDAKQTAVFRGDVVAVQDTFQLNAQQLVVTYLGQGLNAAAGQQVTQAAAGADGAQQQIKRIRATGGVIVRNGSDSNAVSEWADFNVQSGVITLGDNVTLTQQGNVLKGAKLIIDLNAGTSRFETSKRVRAIFKRTPATKPSSQ